MYDGLRQCIGQVHTLKPRRREAGSLRTDQVVRLGVTNRKSRFLGAPKEKH